MEEITGKNSDIILLSETILKEIESTQTNLSGTAAKCLRLARLINDFDALKWFSLELTGYNSKNEEYVPPDEFVLAKRSNRNTISREWKIDRYVTGQEKIYIQSIGLLEAGIESAKQQLQVCQDPDINFHPVTAYQTAPRGNGIERDRLGRIITDNTGILDRIRTAFYNYVLNIYYQYKFSDVTKDIFEEYKEKVDTLIIKNAPDLAKEFKSMHDNLISENEKDWSNIGTNCRRIMKLLADTFNPPKDGIKEINKNGKVIKVTDQDYINRLMIFIEENSISESQSEIVGSQLGYIGDRIDSINNSGSKGVHSSLKLSEARRLTILTYIIAGDILELAQRQPVQKSENAINIPMTYSVSPSPEATSLIEDSPQP